MTVQYDKVPARDGSDHVFLIDSAGDTIQQALKSTKKNKKANVYLKCIFLTLVH